MTGLASPSHATLTVHGHRVAYRVHGDPTGTPVYFFHGFPGSSLQAALVDASARRRKIALVAYDRPGFGHSSTWPAPRVGNLNTVTEALADHLGHERFAVMGVSCGGPYALSTAAHLPNRVHAVGLLAGMAPMTDASLCAGQLPILRVMFTLARWHRLLPAPLLALDRLMFVRNPMRAVELLSSMLAAPDRELLARDPAVRETFALSLADAYRQGVSGALGEAARIARFDATTLTRVVAPVAILQSGEDRHVPPAMGEYLQRHLPRATLHMRPRDGHLSIVVDGFDACLDAMGWDADRPDRAVDAR